MRNQAPAILCIFSFLATSCGNDDQTGEGNLYQIESLQRQINNLEGRLAVLEPSTEDLPFKLGDGGFGFIESNTGGATLQWVGSKANGSGVQLSLRVGNPSTADWNKYVFIGRYGKLDSEGQPSPTYPTPFTANLSQEIPAGSWKTITVQIDGPKVEDVGYIHVDSILISNISLATE